MIKKIENLAAKVVYFLYDLFPTDYMMDAIDHFYRNHDVEYHWRFVKLPLVKKVYPSSFEKKFIRMKPMDRPSGVMFNITWDDDW